MANGMLVFDDEDCFGALQRGHGRGCLGRVRRLIDPRQVDLEDGPLADFAVHPDAAPALFDDAVDRGEAEPRTSSQVLGGEERLEDPRPRRLVHPDARVADRQHHVRPGLHRCMPVGVRLIEHHVPCLDGQRTAVGHGVPGVDREVHDDLLHLAGIGSDAALVVGRSHNQPDVLADQALQHAPKIRRQPAQVQDLECHDLFPAECEQLPRQRSAPLAGLPEVLEIRAQRRVVSQFVQDEVGHAIDDGQQVVEVVGDAAGQPPDRIHLLGLLDLGLQRTLRRQILLD